MITDEIVKDVDEYLDTRQSAIQNGVSPPTKLYEHRSLNFEETLYLIVRQMLREHKVLLIVAGGAVLVTLAIKLVNRFG